MEIHRVAAVTSISNRNSRESADSHWKSALRNSAELEGDGHSDAHDEEGATQDDSPFAEKHGSQFLVPTFPNDDDARVNVTSTSESLDHFLERLRCAHRLDLRR